MRTWSRDPPRIMTLTFPLGNKPGILLVNGSVIFLHTWDCAAAPCLDGEQVNKITAKLFWKGRDSHSSCQVTASPDWRVQGRAVLHTWFPKHWRLGLEMVSYRGSFFSK